MTANNKQEPLNAPPEPESNDSLLTDTQPSSEVTEIASARSSTTKMSQKKGFFLKVYITLILQLSLHVVLCLLSVLVEDVRKFMIQYGWTGFIALLFFGVIIFVMLLCQNLIRFPINVICLMLIGFLGSWPLAVIAAKYAPLAVISALVITFVVAVITTIIAAILPCAINSRCLIYIFTVVTIAVTTSTISMIACYVNFVVIHLVFSSATALVASAYYFFMTLFVIKHIYKVPSDWIFANIALYTAVPGFLVHSLVVLVEMMK